MYLTKEAVTITGRTRMTLYNLVARGDLPKPEKFAGRLLWDRASIDALATKQTVTEQARQAGVSRSTIYRLAKSSGVR